MAYNPQTDTMHYKVYSVYTDRYLNSWEISNKVGVIAVKQYGGNEDEFIKTEAAKQKIHMGYSLGDGFWTDDFGDVAYYLEQ